MTRQTTPDYILQQHSIDVWSCNADTLQEHTSAFFPLLSAEEQSRAERFKFDIHRHQFIAFHGFMRTVLAQYLNIDPIEVLYVKGDKGKPFLDQSCCPNQSLQFNLSHTQNIALLAITSDLEVGIDIEHIDRKTDWKGICQRFFTQAEQKALFSLADSFQEQAFYELWTRKEAYMKVLGSGLSLSPTEFTLTVSPQAPALVEHHSKKIPACEKVEFCDIALPDDLNQYCATLALAGPIEQYNYYQYF